MGHFKPACCQGPNSGHQSRMPGHHVPGSPSLNSPMVRPEMLKSGRASIYLANDNMNSPTVFTFDQEHINRHIMFDSEADVDYNDVLGFVDLLSPNLMMMTPR